MDGLVFLMALIGMVVIVHWSLKNDKVPLNGRTRGLLAMKHPEDPDTDKKEPATAQPKRRTRRPSP